MIEPTSRSKILWALFPTFIILSILIGGVGFLLFWNFEQHRSEEVDIWYAEEITNPYTGVGTVIQVVVRDRLRGNRVIIFEKDDVSSQLDSGTWLLDYSTKDKLFRKTHPWVLDSAVKID